jgi:molecular chaperone GrpE
MSEEEKPQEDQIQQASTPAESNVDYKEAWMRARADYENFRREVEGKRAELAAYAKAGILVDILPVVQHFKQALKYVPEEQQKEAWVVGVKQIQKLMDDFLARHDMKEIETVGKPFDPTRHEAVGKRKQEGVETDVILEEVSSGYTLGGQVIQVAKVIVAE